MEANNTYAFCFVHGFGDSEARFSASVSYLHSHGHSACTVELPDCRSIEPHNHLHDHLIERIIAVFDERRHNAKRVLVGHSLGGLLSISHKKSHTLAERFLMIEPSIRAADLDFFSMLMSLPDGRRIREFSALLETDSSDLPRDYIRNLERWTEKGFEAYCQLAISLLPSAQAALSSLSGKIVLAYGRNSWGSVPKAMKADLGNPETFEFEKSGHWPFYTEVKQFESFLRNASQTQ
jgi:pimeloyl-ACP methyl ester carboxylesterase